MEGCPSALDGAPFRPPFLWIFHTSYWDRSFGYINLFPNPPPNGSRRVGDIPHTFLNISLNWTPRQISQIARIALTLLVEFNSGWAFPPLLMGNPCAHHFAEYQYVFLKFQSVLSERISQIPTTNGNQKIEHIPTRFKYYLEFETPERPPWFPAF